MMKKLTILAFVLVGVSLVTACSSYENSNELEEEDKYVRPEGVHELADFLTQFDTKYTMKTTYNGEVSTVNVDANIKKSVINDVEYFEKLEDYRYYLYDQDKSTYSINVTSQLAIPFDFSDVIFSDFIDMLDDSYSLTEEKLLEFDIDSLIVTYDDDESNILFTTTKDDEVYNSFINAGVVLQIPQKDFDLELYGLDEITNFLVDSNFDNYSVITDFDKFNKLYNTKFVDIYAYHTAEYSDYDYYCVDDEVTMWHVVQYVDGEAVIVDQKYDYYWGKVIQKNSFVTLNMFTSTESVDLYNRILLSEYDEETKMYIYASEGILETYKFNNDYTEIVFDDCNDLWLKHTLYKFGTTTLADFDHPVLVPTDLAYVNLIK